MGVCDSNKSNMNYSKIPGMQHIQIGGNPEMHGYKFDFAGKKNYSNIKFNLKFIFSDFKIKYCTSHKPSRDSTYITEIIIGEKKFPLVINKGQSPNIPNADDINNGYFEQKECTLDELENSYLVINIYEILDDISDPIEDLGNSMPEIYKQKFKYYSFFRISLLSFIFKSKRCDFAMMGTNQLSTKTRISFNCLIEHKEKIGIMAGTLNNHLDYKNLVIRLNNQTITSSTKRSDNSYLIFTPSITMNELQRADLFLETSENYDNYQYLSLNELKAKIIRELCQRELIEEKNLNLIINQPINIKDINDPLNNQEIRNNKLYDDGKTRKIYNQINNNESFLYFLNLPIIGQFSNLYFTEYGNVYSTGILNLINNDPELLNYRKSKNISSDKFYEKLYGYSTELSKPNYESSILNDIHVLLMRSIDNDRFMFIYPSMDDLNQMVNLFIMLGLTIIDKIKNTTDEYQLIMLTKLINILMRRVELDNAVLCECMNKYNGANNNPKHLYNKLIRELFFLYQLLLSNKLQNNDIALIELFSRLYFQKKIFRKAILYSLNRQNILYDYDDLLDQNNIYLYDVIDDEKLNRYLDKETQTVFNDFHNNSDYFKNITFDKYRLLKKIIFFLNEMNINKYPFEFTLFNDNSIILDIIEKDINLLKIENNILSNDCYESLMLLSNSYFAISRINNALIRATNGHNPNAVYTLFIYFKSLFDYYNSSSKCKLIMDYSVFELACTLLSQNEDSVSLPRLFWLYYCCSDNMTSSNIKWFIVNIINKNFDKFAFHWSFTIRQVFFKLAIYILYDKLKEDEGKLFRKEKLISFMDKKINNPTSIYTKEAVKDFNTVHNEYKNWLKIKKDNIDEEYPIFFLPAPISNNGTID